MSTWSDLTAIFVWLPDFKSTVVEVIATLETPPVFISTVSDPKFTPVLLSVPVSAGAEADPSTPEIPVVPSIFKAIMESLQLKDYLLLV